MQPSWLMAETLVIAVDASPDAAALYFADKHFIAPRGLGDDFISFLCDICAIQKIQLLIPTRDEELPILAANKGKFDVLGVTIMVPPLSVINICQDKQVFLDFCVDNNFSIPDILDPYGILDFPVFIRNRTGKGSKSAFRCDSQLELDVLLKKLDAPIVQEYVDANEYTVDLYATLAGGTVISAIPRQRIYTFGGESFVGRTDKHWPIMEESIRLSEALELRGHNTIQCFDHDGVIKFIEVNPRFGGGASLGFAAGVYTPDYLLTELAGKPLNSAIGKFEDGLTMLRYTEDYFIKQ
jgi:carbamoyl-phosphate synthase large subunit